MGIPALVYCADGNPDFARVAVELGWRYGARLPATVYQPVWFADQNWMRPDLGKYKAAIAEHRPEVATVLDWEHDDQLAEVLGWAEEIAPHVARVVIIPKVPGRVGEIPETVGGRPVVLGFSVPTSYGGTTCGTWEFGRRPVHLLGGSPQSQMRFARYLNVVSADGNMMAQQARRGRVWAAVQSRKGHWTQLRELGDMRTEGVPLECFRRSLEAIRQQWAVADRRIRPGPVQMGRLAQRRVHRDHCLWLLTTEAPMAEPRPAGEPLTWTTDPPAVPGWYWWRYSPTSFPRILVFDLSRAGRLIEEHTNMPLASIITLNSGSEWAGPIPEPAERRSV